MRSETIIVGIVMLLLGIGIGCFIGLGRLFLETRDLMHEIVRQGDGNLDPVELFHGTGDSMSEAGAQNAEVKVRVLAKQYTWHFHYPGGDGAFGATDAARMSATNPLGLDLSDPAAADDLCNEELVLPCGTTAGLWVTSSDFVHSLRNLQPGFKLDAVPGFDAPAALETPPNPRTGRLQCAQLCGPGHADHHAPYRFVSRSDYDDWIARQLPFATLTKTE